MQRNFSHTLLVVGLSAGLWATQFCHGATPRRQLATRSLRSLGVQASYDRVRKEAKQIPTNRKNISERTFVLNRITSHLQNESLELGAQVRQKLVEIRQQSRGRDLEMACRLVDEMFNWVEALDGRTKDGKGTAQIKPSSLVPAEAKGTWEIVYTAGPGGIQVGGGIKIDMFDSFGNRIHDFTTNRWSYIQIEEPQSPGYTTISCSNRQTKLNAKVERYRPSERSRWGIVNHLAVTVDEKPLRQGDRITIIWGDKSQGGSGTIAPMIAREYVFPLLVDADGDGGYGEIADSPSISITGRAASRFHVVMPTIIKAGEDVTVKVVAVDKHGNIDSNFRGRVKLSSTDKSATLLSSYRFTESDAGRHEFSNIRFNTKGIHYLEAKDRNISGRSNPAKVSREAPYGGIYWGDIHAHTKNCDGTPSVDEAWIYARDVSCLDFAAVSTHLNFPSFIEDDEWAWLCSQVRHYHEDGKFVAIHGFEHNSCGGHKNIYWPDDNPPKSLKRFLQMETRRGPESFWDYLRELSVIAIPHHPAGSFPGGVDWRWSNDEVTPLIEITQVQGTAEYYGNPNHQRTSKTKGLFAQDGLAMGFKIGFIGASDFHEAPCGSLIELKQYERWARIAHQFQGGGIAGVYAPNLTRKEIFNGLRTRYCFATTGERILVEFNIDGHRMGSAYTTNDPPKIDVTVAGTAPLEMIEMIKNNEVIFQMGRSVGHDATFDRDLTYTASFSFVDEEYRPTDHWDYYYARATQRDSEMAWSSPIWIQKK